MGALGAAEIGNILAATSLGVGMIDRSQQARAADQQARAQAEAQAREIETTRRIEERRRQEKLRKAQATQRARFGALGVGGGGGSAEAVLSGLEAASAREGLEANSLLDDRLQSINDRYAARPRRNLLLDSSLDVLGLLSKISSQTKIP